GLYSKARAGLSPAPSRDFHLAHVNLGIHVDSWMAVELNDTGLPYRFSSGRLGAMSSSLPRLLLSL
ncbi:MAG: hypothetical protein QXU90_03500, partial [Acidilobaceae archaeon]